MILKNSLIYLNQFFFFISNKFREVYLNSKIYNKKISKVKKNNINYKPSPSLLECIVKIKNEKKNISKKIFLKNFTFAYMICFAHDTFFFHHINYASSSVVTNL